MMKVRDYPGMTPEQKKRIYELDRLIENEQDATKLKMYNAELERLIDIELDDVHIARSFATVEDTSGCDHTFIVGPQRIIKNLHVGHCDACKREVAIELDAEKNRTGKSWLIEYSESAE